MARIEDLFEWGTDSPGECVARFSPQDEQENYEVRADQTKVGLPIATVHRLFEEGEDLEDNESFGFDNLFSPRRSPKNVDLKNGWTLHHFQSCSPDSDNRRLYQGILSRTSPVKESPYAVTWRINYLIGDNGDSAEMLLRYWIHEQTHEIVFGGEERNLPDGRFGTSWWVRDREPSFPKRNHAAMVDLETDERWRRYSFEDYLGWFRAERNGPLPENSLDLNDYVFPDEIMAADDAILHNITLIEGPADYHVATFVLRKKLDFVQTFINLVAVMNCPRLEQEALDRLANLSYVSLREPTEQEVF